MRLAQEIAARDDRYVMLFQYANEANPRAHYEGTGLEIARDLPRVDALVAGLGTGGTLMGTGARLREAFPDVQVVAAEPLPGDPVMGLRSLEDGYVPPVLDVAKLDRKLLVSNTEAAAAVRVLLEREGLFAGVSAGAVVHVARRIADELPEGSVVVAVLADGGWKYLSAPFWTWRGDRRGGALVVVPAAIREELSAHAAEEAPNECCGLLVFRDGVAERYERGRNALASPYRYELEIDPALWFLEDEGYELAVFHSHPETEPIPSRTDRELAGLWSGRPFLIYGLKLDELRAWRIARDGVEELPLTAT